MRTSILFSLTFLFLLSCNKDENKNDNVTINDDDKQGLIYTRQEEKLAYDVYRYAFDKYGLSIFDNISNSESTHQSKVIQLLEKYNIPDPIVNVERGVFDDTHLQELYIQLVKKVDISLVDALEVGATIEDLDIYDIMELYTITKNADIKNVYESLICGSRNHLRGFTSQLTSRDFNYSPQFITPDLYQTILSGSHENCGN
ncbi:MAG: DUF2202 domain-containing protein [Lewinellaceae bacterium]|nr:DUF2202 domain-containing protein [Lewinellaceae bacterium]